jgi:hypothetical protein
MVIRVVALCILVDGDKQYNEYSSFIKKYNPEDEAAWPPKLWLSSIKHQTTRRNRPHNHDFYLRRVGLVNSEIILNRPEVFRAKCFLETWDD